MIFSLLQGTYPCPACNRDFQQLITLKKHVFNFHADHALDFTLTHQGVRTNNFSLSLLLSLKNVVIKNVQSLLPLVLHTFLMFLLSSRFFFYLLRTFLPSLAFYLSFCYCSNNLSSNILKGVHCCVNYLIIKEIKD